MCKIIDDYAHELADERAAEVLVKNVETLAETTGSIDNACSLLKITRRHFWKKALSLSPYNRF